MRMVITGPPAVGKGSLAPFLEKKYDIIHISTGQMFREEIKKGSKLGLKLKEILNKGELVSDELTNEMVKIRLGQKDVKNGFLLDGYPRNINQAKYLDQLLKVLGLKLDYVVVLYADIDILIKRVIGRRVCPKCGRIYNVYFLKPQVEGLCDDDQSVLIARSDDKEEVLRQRIAVYHEKTEPIINYYKNHNNLLMVNGGYKTSKETFEELIKLIGDKK